MQPSFFNAISISSKNAPVDVREQIALNEGEAKNFMVKVQEIFDASEVLVVSTCNRTEIYHNAPLQSSNEAIAKLLLIEKGLTDTANYLPYFAYYDQQTEAVLHLFKVATGLHSQVVGDMQIPNQVKQAYQWSADMGMAGPFLHRLLHSIFFTNKRVAQETTFRDGAASTAYAAVELVKQVAAAKANPHVLLLGLGDLGTDVCRNLKEKGFTNITLVNRTRQKADELAAELELTVCDFDQAANAILQADVVVSSIVRPEPFITRELLEKQTIFTFKYLIDLSVPRSIAANAEEVPGVVVYNIDYIQQRTNEATARRVAAIPQVEALIEAAIAEFSDWSKEMAVSPTIQKLKNALEQIRQEEIGRYLKSLDAEEAARLDKITASMMQKILKQPVVQLKAACKRGDAENLVEVLSDLFNLEKAPYTPAVH
ncbi:MAG: glutamyl-tRNA reductase [Runella slithyformis]|nr:MAG: glutamyl-tRNA reductase [Runella slithyformis]TAF25160.1 MAG: glutamyl-tRNA reductase [Runella slithyformis]TAF49916.1 MAG: glutamyl-tRNA reductase [Runella slithyformis]TAF79631.1 MAG: glutamyl-tRNA reductase [Runella slithyformis]